MSERDLGTYQMLWDCPACGTPKLLGLDHRHCPNCGAAQDAGRRYFPSDADKVAVKDHRYTGADKICPACEAPAAASANNCASCGSSLGEGKAAAKRAEQRAAGAFGADSAKAASQEHKLRRAAEKASAAGAATPARGGSSGWLKWVAIGVVALALVVYVFTRKKAVEVEVLGHGWSRSIQIEELRKVSESAWKSEVPGDATGVSCSREKRGTKKVADGETCTNVRKDMGDGTFKEVRECSPKYREEPEYDDRCRFTVERWRDSRLAKAEGASLAEAPRWPDPEIRRAGSCLGCEREGARREVYQVRLRMAPGGKEDSCELDEGKWRSLQVGQRRPAKARALTGGLVCDSL